MLREETLQYLAPAILRAALTGLFLWFGLSQVSAPNDWISWVPTWVPSFAHLDAKTIVLVNGSFEVIGGILLLLGLYIRWVALLLCLHLLLIAYEIGYNDIGVRDFSLAVCTLSLALFNGDSWSLQRRM